MTWSHESRVAAAAAPSPPPRRCEAGRLVRVLEAVPRVVRGIYVVYAPSPFTPAKVRLFVAALRDSFRTQRAPS